MFRIIGYFCLGLLIAFLIAGCATNQQTGQAVGGVTGAIIGNQVGGGVGKSVATAVGAVVGAKVGGAIGEDMDRHQDRAAAKTGATAYPVYGWGGGTPFPQCSSYYPGTAERAACERGARQRMMEEQRRQEHDAYRRGLGR